MSQGAHLPQHDREERGARDPTLPRLGAPIIAPLGDRRHGLDRRHAGSDSRALRATFPASSTSVRGATSATTAPRPSNSREAKRTTSWSWTRTTRCRPRRATRSAELDGRRVHADPSLRGHRVRAAAASRRSHSLALRGRAARVRHCRRAASVRAARRSVDRACSTRVRAAAIPRPIARTPRSSRPRWRGSPAIRATRSTSPRACATQAMPRARAKPIGVARRWAGGTRNAGTRCSRRPCSTSGSVSRRRRCSTPTCPRSPRCRRAPSRWSSSRVSTGCDRSGDSRTSSPATPRRCRAPRSGLFVDDACYAWRALDELAIAAWYVGARDEGRHAAQRLLSECRFPNTERARMEANLATYDPPRG